MEELVEQARVAWEAQDWMRSAALYQRLAIEAPNDRRVGDWWYDAALAQKFLRNWAEAYRLGILAAANAPRGRQDPAFWNLGIAATIQRDWATARDAWAGFGITMPPGEGPIEGRFGRACVRITGTDGQEVVWVERLCPTRARVVNVPFDTSRRYGEIVVHDGEPKGDRVIDGQTYRVFDELVLFEASDLATLAVTVTVTGQGDLDELADRLGALGFGFEPMGNGEILCKCCSEGTVNHRRAELSGEQRCLVAAPLEQAREILDAWRGPTRTWTDLHPAP
ncbi:hypothetical protein F4553_007886 [Allocatelliglobosispora scoriae]|uniref:Tetratricopeptide repeat protein n=1 Tax=Allocatelliglobosispora scoriae TaxID=643052 RepID=A0A841C5V1_9ACTN|nr:tetratricopeptide repeat protein [Allocatelliglobosispora scoriae]MBB5874452.1 hypothetical protein [Allocatelliglobosispora scoriae]